MRTAPSTLIDLRPAGIWRPRETTALKPSEPQPRVRVADLVTWTDPAGGARWPGVRVDFVYPMQGTACVRGYFGREARGGGEHIQTKVVPLAQLSVTGRAEDVQS